MASTYSPSLKLTLMGDGDQAGLWGQTTNTNLGTLLEQAITGVQSITMSDANYTLTNFNGISDEARNAVLVVTGTNNAVRDLIPPVVEKLYIVANNTTGGYAIRVIGATGTGISIPSGATQVVYCDGTNFIAASGAFVNGTVLGVAGGGTGLSTLTANNVILGNGASSPTFVAPGTAGNALVSNGSTWISQAAGGGFATGTVMLFAQTTAPTGWTKNTSTGNNSALRVVTGSASTGGSVGFTTAFASQTPTGSVSITAVAGSAGATTLTTPQIPSHAHAFRSDLTPPYTLPIVGGGGGNSSNTADSFNTGGGGSHTHPFSFSSGSGTFTGNAINLAVQYIDVIRATKD
jgi:hypothetical protein